MCGVPGAVALGFDRQEWVNFCRAGCGQVTMSMGVEVDDALEIAEKIDV